MNVIILLDAGPLGMLANPKGSQTTQACKLWLQTLLQKGARVAVPEIADYEVRRELLRASLTASVQGLDILKQSLEYLPLIRQQCLKLPNYGRRCDNKANQPPPIKRWMPM